MNEQNYKTSVNNVNEELQVSHVTDLKRRKKLEQINEETLLPDNMAIDVAFQGKQLSSYFNIKDKRVFA